MCGAKARSSPPLEQAVQRYSPSTLLPLQSPSLQPQEFPASLPGYVHVGRNHTTPLMLVQLSNLVLYNYSE